MNLNKRIAELEAELAEEDISVTLLFTEEGMVPVGKYIDRCLARNALKRKGVTVAPCQVEDYEPETPR